MASPYVYKKTKILFGLGLNNTSNKVNCNLPILYTLHESRGDIGNDACLDISDKALNDVHLENALILLTDNTHVTKHNPYIRKFSKLNPYAKIFVNKVGHTVAATMGQVVSELSETFYDNEFVNKDFSDIQLVHKKAETWVNFPVYSFQISYLIYFCYFLSVCVYACICTPIESTRNSYLIGNTIIPIINDMSKLDIIDNNDNNDDNDNSSEGEIPDILINNLRLKHLGRLIIGHLNIKSIRNKFEALQQIIKNNLDILVVSETKLDNTFPDKQFSMDGYRTIRQDREPVSYTHLTLPTNREV